MSELPVVTPPESGPGTSHLDHSLLHGIAWTGGVKWAAQAMSWASTLVVARILSPEDYGIFSMAAAYVGFLTVASEFGIGTAVVTIRDLSRDQLAQLNALSIVLGLTVLGACAGAAVPLGKFFRTPQLPAVLLVLSMSFVIASFKSVPLALLQRELRFKLISLIDGFSALALALASVLLAFAGFRYWTLVLGSVLSTAISTTLVLVAQRCGFRRPRLASLRKSLTISRHILVNRLSWYAYSNADFVVAGRVLGKAPLGAYTVGWTLASTPIQQTTNLVGAIATPFLSKVQGDYDTVRRYFLNLTEGLSLLTFPMTIGMALVAHDFVLTILGAKWQAVVLPLHLLAAYASVRSITPFLSHVLTVTGETRFGMEISLVSLVAYPTAFYIGARWGTLGIATAWIIVDPLLNLPSYWKVFRKLHVTTGQYLAALRPALTGVALMTVAVLLVQRALPQGWPTVVRLVLQVAAGALSYLGALALFHRPRLIALYTRIRAARGRGAE